jgi:antirestriction protein ArdC
MKKRHPMTKEDRQAWRDQHALITAKAAEHALEAGTAPWVRPWAAGEAYGTGPMNAFRRKPYSGRNAVYLSLVAIARGYDRNDWVTFKQAQEMGARVLKGEKSGVFVEKWIFPSDRQDNGDDATDTTPDESKRRAPYVRFYPVFNACQVDGLPPVPAPPQPAWVRHQEAENIIQRLGVPIAHAGNQAFYSPSEDRIQLPPPGLFRDQDGYYSTLLHECGHATGHVSRLNRDLSARFGTPGYAREELKVELASLLMSQRVGTSHDPSQHHAYIGQWIKLLRDNPGELYQAAKDAEAICEYMGVGVDYDLTARAAALGSEEHAQRLAAEQQADTLRQQRDKAAALLSQATATPAPETPSAAPESASRRRPSIA